MNISRVSNSSIAFKSALPSYRVEPFNSSEAAVMMGVNPATDIPPTLVFYNPSPNERTQMYKGVIAQYDYPMPARSTTKYTLVLPNNKTTYTCDGDSMMDTTL